MSAFIVDTETMDRCLEAILTRSRGGPVVREVCGIKTDEPDAATRIGRALYALNVFSVGELYPSTAPHELPGPAQAFSVAANYVFRGHVSGSPIGIRPKLVPGAKALACLKYQSCEGGAFRTESYRSLTAALDAVHRAIVEDLPEWQAAKWG